MSENLMRIWPKLNKDDKQSLLAWANNIAYTRTRITEDELIFMPMEKFLRIITYIDAQSYAEHSRRWVRSLKRKLGEEVEKVHG